MFLYKLFCIIKSKVKTNTFSLDVLFAGTGMVGTLKLSPKFPKRLSLVVVEAGDELEDDWPEGDAELKPEVVEVAGGRNEEWLGLFGVCTAAKKL